MNIFELFPLQPGRRSFLTSPETRQKGIKPDKFPKTMVNLKNKQTFYPVPVGAVSNRTGAECPIDSKVYHK